MAVDEGELLLGGVQVAGEGGGGQAGVGEEDRGGTGGRSGILAEVVAEPPAASAWSSQRVTWVSSCPRREAARARAPMVS